MVLAAVLSACPGSETSGSFADPRLGVLVFETNDRPFSRAPPPEALSRNDGHVLQNRARLVFTADGSILVVIGLDAGRPFGTANDVTPSRVVVKKVSPTGSVTELPSPSLGSFAFLKQFSLQLAGDGASPVLIDVNGPANPAGRYVTITTLDGTTWKSVAFLRSDRAPLDASGIWDELNDQVRVTKPGIVFVQHHDTLVRHDGTRWAPIMLPAKAKQLRLGAADATRVRAYWTTTDGAIESDVLNADGSWAGEVSRIRRGTSPSLTGAWGFAGDPDTFTLHVVSGLDVLVLRHERGLFTQAATRPLVNSELEGKAFLFGTRHPRRSAFFANGQLTASVAGRETGALGPVIGWSAGPQVTCEGDVAVKEGHVVAKDGAKCVPRALDALDFRLSDDVMTLAELFEDTQQDATLRYYVKRIPLPTNNVDVTKDVPALGGFPGGDEPVVTGDQLSISGHVLAPGVSDHTGTACTLFRSPTQLVVESVMVDTDGAVRFSPVTRGDYEVQCTRPLFNTFTQRFTAAQQGEVALDGVISSPLLQDGEVLHPGASEYQLDGGTLLHLGAGTAQVLSSTVATGDSVRLVGADVVWREADGTVRAGTGTLRFPAPRTLASFRRANSSTVVASGVPDGVTPLSWTRDATPMLAAPAVELAQFGQSGGCSGHLVWTLVGPGDVRVQRGDCQTPIGLNAATLSQTSAPPMKTVWFSNVVFGFVGDDCGAEGSFTKACPAHSVNVQLGGPLVSNELSATALDVRAQVVQGLGSRLLLLEGNGATATLRAGAFGDPTTSIVVQTGIPLPPAWLAGETPITFLEGQQRFLVRTDSEVFSSLGTAGSWTRVAGNVRAVFAGGVVLQNDGTLLRVLGTGATEVLPMKGNDNLRFTGTGVLVSDEETMTCPDGSTCHVITRMTPDKVVTPLGVGRFSTDVVATPRRFGQPMPRELFVDALWPSRRATVVP